MSTLSWSRDNTRMVARRTGEHAQDALLAVWRLWAGGDWGG